MFKMLVYKVAVPKMSNKFKSQLFYNFWTVLFNIIIKRTHEKLQSFAPSYLEK